MMLRPLPGGALVLLAVAVMILVSAVPEPHEKRKPDDTRPAKKLQRDDPRYMTAVYEQALGGYANDSVWLVLAAYFMSRGLIKTGLARRIALTFVRLLGGNTLGLSYALAATDTVLRDDVRRRSERKYGWGDGLVIELSPTGETR